ncbi:MAG TPA: DNA mismatch repair protein MutL, partial [Flavobacterium sp.]|nr:DNA mismatch repair protein MutL [Flavobacterium sp.]
VDLAFNPFQDDKHLPRIAQRRESASWESLYVGLDDVETVMPDQVVWEQETVTSSLFDETQQPVATYRTYQIHRKYIVSPIKSGMVIVDQQRAHQRVLYEEFLASMTVRQSASQQLLFPLSLFFSPSDRALIESMKPSLEGAGFMFIDDTDGHVVISGVPVNVTESEVSIVLEDLISDLQDGIPESSFSQNDSIARSLARSVAVKTGTYLSEKEQESLVNALFACKEPNVSPFNKPTFITMSVEDLDKKFAL